MKRIFIALLFAIFLTAACSQRPKIHHPQPEQSAKQQILRVFFASVNAYTENDHQRLSLLVAPQWAYYNKPAEKAEKQFFTNQDFGTRIYGMFFKDMNKDEVLNWLITNRNSIFIAGEYDIKQDKEDNTNKVPEVFRNEIEKGDFILITPPKPDFSKSLIIVFSAKSGKWQIIASSII